MANFSLPQNIDATYADNADPSYKLHQQYHDTIHSLVDRFDTTVVSGTPTTGDVVKWNGTGLALAAETAGAMLWPTADRVWFVSKAGSDANNGRSPASAFLTVAAALTANANFPATINIGNGTYDESSLVFGNGIWLRGSSVGSGTVLRLTSTGTLVDLSNQTGVGMENIRLSFSSSSVTGTLLKLSNAFRCHFERVQFVGTSTTGQVGIWLLANAGDCQFNNCLITNNQIGVQNDTTINTFTGCNFQGNTTAAIKGGDVTGATWAAGLLARDCVFGGTSTYYLDLAGTSQAWFFDGCWLDAGPSATTGIRVGTGTFGPWLFSWTNSGSLFGNTTSLLLNASDNTIIDQTVFGNDGSNPTEISVPTPANVVRGRIGRCLSLQGGSGPVESMVPATFEGWKGYAYYDSGQITLVETSEYQYSNPSNSNQKRVVIRFNGRSSGQGQTVITFPAAFTTSQFFKVFDNTAATGLVLTSTTLTIPTANAVSSGMIIIEGW